MPPFLQDAFDIARFRAKPLEHYVYDWWQPVLWLTFLGAMPAINADVQLGVLPLMLLSVVLTWVSAVVMTLFFGWWLKKNGQWSGQGSLFPVVVLATSSQLLGPIIGLLPDDVAQFMAIAAVIYQLSVLAHVFEMATGAEKRHVVLGFLAYFGFCLALAFVLTVIGMAMGWLPTTPPPATAPAALPANLPVSL